MAWIDPEWELDPNEDAKRMAREHPTPNTRENRALNRVTLIVMSIVCLSLIGACIATVVYLG